MGRIKSTMVKKAARQLIVTPDTFTEDFEHNKKMLRGLMPSKPIQNKVAGYISRLIKMQNAEKEKRAKAALAPATPQEPISSDSE